MEENVAGVFLFVNMPWTKKNPPNVAKNWTDSEKAKCVAAANAVIADGGGDDEAIYACINAAGKSKKSEASMTDEMTKDFSYFELQMGVLEDGKPFDGMAPGEFISMWGQKVVIKKGEMKTYLENTLAAIQNTVTESGELVGLPIDAMDHRDGDGAGWIVDASLEDVEKPDGQVLPILRFTAKWTEIGKEVISKGLRRMFSPSLDSVEKVVVGGSLTNWPATRDKKGKILLRPIELSQDRAVYIAEKEVEDQEEDTGVTDASLEDPETQSLESEDNMEINELLENDEFKTQLGLLVGGQVKEEMKAGLKEVFAEMKQSKDDGEDADPDAPKFEMDMLKLFDLGGMNAEFQEAAKEQLMQLYREMQGEAKHEAARMLRAAKRESDISEFSMRVIGGTDDNPVGIPAELERFKSFCLGLDEADLDYFTNLIDGILTKGLVSFSEKGHSKEKEGTAPLPEYYALKLRAGEMTMADLQNPLLAPDLGDLGQYNLSEWKED